MKGYEVGSKDTFNSNVTTKKGDLGNTGLYFGVPVSKSHARLDAYGTIDELNAVLGMIRSVCNDTNVNSLLHQIQKKNFTVCSELATTDEHKQKLKSTITKEELDFLEKHLQYYERTEGIVFDWAIPGNNIVESYMDLARTICRRAERNTVRLHEAGEINNIYILKYLNRLSDLLWILGRYIQIDSE